MQVRDRRGADAMSHCFQRHLVMSLIGRDASVSELVAESGRPMSSVHYHVRRLTTLGLLKVASSAPRRGRPIQRYTAAAEAIFVASHLMREGPGVRLDRELRAALDSAGDEIDGIIFYRDDQGGMWMRDMASKARGARVAADIWRIAELDERDARQLAQDLDMLLRKAAGRAATGRKAKYLIRCAVLRRDDDTLFAP